MASYTKNKYLAQNAKLLPNNSKTDIDLYTQAKEHVWSYLGELRDFYLVVKARYPKFI